MNLPVFPHLDKYDLHKFIKGPRGSLLFLLPNNIVASIECPGQRRKFRTGESKISPFHGNIVKNAVSNVRD